jgi:DNA-binding transcriptional LysR family regulator
MLEKHNRKLYYNLMDIRVLKYFLAVAREGSITKAANVLHVTQPTLSRQLQDLEKELKHKLLVRGQHSVSLTTEGHILRQRAEEIVDMAEKTKNEFLSTKDVIKGTIYIGSGESDAISLITDIVKNVQTEYREIKFDFLSGNADDLCEKLDKGLLDFAVLIEPVNISKYDYITLPKKDRWGIIMKKNCSLAKKDKIKLEDLKNLPLIISSQLLKKTSVNDIFFKWFKGGLKNLNIVATYNLFYNAGLMINSGVGYALTLDKLANVTSISNLTFRPLSPKLESNLNIVWKKTQLFSPAAKVFLENLKKEFTKLK